MSLSRSACVFVLLIGSFVAAQGQEGNSVPSNDEVELVLTQTDRAIQQYELAINDEQTEMGKDGSGAVSKDREVVDSLRLAVKVFRKQPQAFNGPLGFAFFEWLDDASRNAEVCANYASGQVAVQIMRGNANKAQSLMHLGQSCSDASTLIYTVSENAGALYQRYIKSIGQAATACASMLEKCTAALKKGHASSGK